MLLVANLGETDIKQAAAWLERSGLLAFASQPGLAACAVAAPIEAEMAELAPEDAKAFRDDLGLAEPGLDRVIRSTYELLGLVSFLTAGEDECRAWTVRRGTRAQLAAGRSTRTSSAASSARRWWRSPTSLRPARSPPAARRALCGSRGATTWSRDGDVIEFKFNV